MYAGTPIQELSWPKRFADSLPTRQTLALTRARLQDERERGAKVPAVQGVLQRFEQQLEHVDFDEREAYQEGTAALLERYGQLQWLKHQRAFVERGGSRPSLIAYEGPRKFSGTKTKWKNAVTYVQDGELWEDELATLGILGADRCE